jgi:hypothetical protein
MIKPYTYFSESTLKTETRNNFYSLEHHIKKLLFHCKSFLSLNYLQEILYIFIIFRNRDFGKKNTLQQPFQSDI